MILGGRADLERWIDDTRATQQQDLARLAEVKVGDALTGGRYNVALQYARLLFALDPSFFWQLSAG